MSESQKSSDTAEAISQSSSYCAFMSLAVRCCCDSPAALISSSVVQLEEVFNSSQIVP